MKLFLVKGRLITGKELIKRNASMKPFVSDGYCGQVCDGAICCDLGPETMQEIDEYNSLECASRGLFETVDELMEA